MISDEAVEAALRALFPAPERDHARDIAWAQSIVVILEAAAPHMLVGARGQGDEAWDRNRVAIGDNPFRRSQA